MSHLNSQLVIKLIDLALEEDLSFGDITSELLEDSTEKVAHILARQDLIVCGLAITHMIVERSNLKIRVVDKVVEGEKIKEGIVIQELVGPGCSLTSIERTILNFLQRLSGVATYTRSIVEQSHGLVILDTRKTTPGFRILEKYATSIGGAKNHRMHLGEMIMIKNNHIDAAPAPNLESKIDFVLSRAKSKSGFYIPIEVEVRDEEELKLVLKHKPEAVLLDNMNDQQLEECVTIVKEIAPETICEASGGITPSRFKKLSEIGIDAASIGSLTTQARNVDISMKIKS